MANDLRIAIATHGAVWSHKMEATVMNFGKQTDSAGTDSESTTVKGVSTHGSKLIQLLTFFHFGTFVYYV